MRRTSILLLILALLPSFSWADPILQVNSWATWFTKNPSCTSNCTQTVAVDFLFDPTKLDESGWIIDASTFHTASSGFLGSFSPGIRSDGTIRTDNVELWMVNGLGDEIGLNGFDYYDGPRVGNNTMRWEFWNCRSAACQDAFPGSETYVTAPDATYQASKVTRISVPEPNIFVLLLVAAVACTISQMALYRHTRRTL